MWSCLWLAGTVLSVAAALDRGSERPDDPLPSPQGYHRLRHAGCTYTFLLPELDSDCGGAGSGEDAEARHGVQRDAPPLDGDASLQRLQLLETAVGNVTRWLHKLETRVQENAGKAGFLHNLSVEEAGDVGSMLFAYSHEQNQWIANIEMQLVNQTSKLEMKVLENALSMNKLERQVLMQKQAIEHLHEKNSVLEGRLTAMQDSHEMKLQMIVQEKRQLQKVVEDQAVVVSQVERHLEEAERNSSLLQQQQQEMMHTLQSVLNMLTHAAVNQQSANDEVKTEFQDCADLHHLGKTNSGIYSVSVRNMSEPFVKVYCDMETDGGGWTVFQRRKDGSLDFHRTWKEYKLGFGDPVGEHWLGNEVVHQLTSHKSYVLRVGLRDWEGHEAFSLYNSFAVESEAHNFRLHARGYSGTAGKFSSLGMGNPEFSTRDVDNDACACKCSQMSSGGWWFDACGPSNLNGAYYGGGQYRGRINGVKWHYWRGVNYSLRETVMMIRPKDF
ncbi:angiopoietin-2-like [Petromyzon marinus]|uniref:Angiopoietin-2-like isoform X2 n=1 Tax=Petromyzon marinus TaxID=7757 RepID=A0AAJ7WV19_PETMA|nr:angiopoietin-2-like isoform X2 [Petromyzon marinus]